MSLFVTIIVLTTVSVATSDKERGLNAIMTAESEILSLYGNLLELRDFESAEFLSDAGRQLLVERVARAVKESSSFVVAVGGMSDVAGHGNLFEESYPRVLERAAAPAFAAAGVRFESRNMAMGGVPSFPNSACMVDTFGGDVDMVVWDFRMVERDEIKGEMYVRQAMMMPKSPFVEFKRKNPYLKTLHYAHDYVHVLDEMRVYNLLQKKGASAVASDTFCENGCECPGQVRWHAGWKMQRFRGLHMALFYLGLLKDALLLDPEHTPSSPPRSPRSLLHSPVSKSCDDLFCSRTFRCATSWAPRVGQDIVDIVDPQLGLSGWRVQHGSKRAATMTKQGHANCGYKDEKKALVGDSSSHWIFFTVKNVKDTVAFCGDFQDKNFASYALIVVNQEEVMDRLDQWLESKTLGISSSCFSTTHNVQEGENSIGFRVTSGTNRIALTHVLWNTDNIDQVVVAAA